MDKEEDTIHYTKGNAKALKQYTHKNGTSMVVEMHVHFKCTH